MENSMQRISEAAHACMSLRLSSCYKLFNLLQLGLACLIIVLLYSKRYLVAQLIEISSAFLISIDLLIKSFSEQNQFYCKSSNWIDMACLGLLLLCIGSGLAFPPFMVNSRTWEAYLLVARYFLQTVRVLILVRASKNLSHIHRENEVVDLKEAQTDDTIE